FDDWLPEVAVGSDGFPYGIWFDWRDAVSNCGGGSTIYTARSVDGGTSWAPSQRLASVITNWTFVSTNIIPNQGDYIHLYGGAAELRPVWADGRAGTPDVNSTGVGTDFTTASCRGDTATAGGGGEVRA